ncbi:MAG: hypothetical protein GY940_07670 [bacterium]|nr:hypothetical protein [bacterium]
MSDTQNNNKLYQFCRNNYFYGKLMTVRDFEAEQDYINEKRHLLNRLVHGAGVLCGMSFSEGDVYADGNNIKIKFPTGGVAIDCWGREIVVPEPGEEGAFEKEVLIYENQEKVNLTTSHIESDVYYFYLEYTPRDVEIVNTIANPPECSQSETFIANRVIEDFEVIASTGPPAPSSIVCPDFSTAITGVEAAAAIKIWFRTQMTALCSGCEDTAIFILALEQSVPGSGDVSIDTGTSFQHLSFIADSKLLTQLLSCHITDFNNPHRVTADQVEALSTSGGTVTGPVYIETTEWGALSASAAATYGLLGRVTADLATGPSYRAGGVVGISEIDGKHGVYAKAPTTGNALYVEGNAFFTGAKSGYVVDTFKNAGGAALKNGDIVKLKNSPISRFYGDDDKIPVPEVTLADKENDECIIGIVDRRAIPDDPKDTSAPGSESEPFDPSVIPEGEELVVVTLGTYARCKVDASKAPIKRGNLLTSSKNPGHAQKAVKPKIGRIIGKALEPLKEGTGYIAVFVNIQ